LVKVHQHLRNPLHYLLLLLHRPIPATYWVKFDLRVLQENPVIEQYRLHLRVILLLLLLQWSRFRRSLRRHRLPRHQLLLQMDLLALY
jgi:hypothetical protein